MPDTYRGPDVPAGWYPDPTDPGRRRYWDGARWSSDISAHTDAVRQDARPAKLPGLTLLYSYLGAGSIPIIGYVVGYMAARRGQYGHAWGLWILATISLLAYLSATSA